MTHEDIGEVVVIENESFSVPWSYKSFEDSLNLKYGRFFVAKLDKKIVGYIGLYLVGDDGDITNVAVSSDYRRKGIAGKLISENNDVERYFMSLLKNGDLIIADTAEDEIVGKCAELQGISDEFVVAGLHTIAIRPNNKFANCYLAFYMNSSAYRKQLTPLMQGVKVLSISRSAISKTEIYFPSSILEQEKIAKCLDSLENLIESYERKIEVLNIQKKGLMQKLFPRL